MSGEQTEPSEEGLDIELTEQPPVCRHVGRKASEPCWGAVKYHSEGGALTCVGHACTNLNGRYYSEADLTKARKTGGGSTPCSSRSPQQPSRMRTPSSWHSGRTQGTHSPWLMQR